MSDRRRCSFLVLLFCVVLGISSCTSDQPGTNEPPSEKTAKHIYFIFVPKSSEQIKQARTLLGNAEAEDVITTGNSYTVLEICNTDKPSTLVPRITLEKKKNINAVTAQAFRSFKEKSDNQNQTNCQASLKSLEEVVKMLSHAAKEQRKGRLIAFIQAPWMVKADDEVFLSGLTAQIEALKSSNQVEKIVLFGLNENSAQEISTPFASLAKDGKFESATDITQLIPHIEKISQQLNERGE